MKIIGPNRASVEKILEDEYKKLSEILCKNYVSALGFPRFSASSLRGEDIIRRRATLNISLEVQTSRDLIPKLKSIGYQCHLEWDPPLTHNFEKAESDVITINLFTEIQNPRNIKGLEPYRRKLTPEELEARKKHPDAYFVTLGENMRPLQYRLKKCKYSDELRQIADIRQKYFSEYLGIQDPYTSTFEDENHKHYTIYRSDNYKIVAYAHIQFWPSNGVFVRFLHVDEDNRKLGFGTDLLDDIERMMQIRYKDSIYLHVPPRLVGFFQRHDYRYMALDDPYFYITEPESILMGKYFEE